MFYRQWLLVVTMATSYHDGSAQVERSEPEARRGGARGVVSASGCRVELGGFSPGSDWDLFVLINCRACCAKMGRWLVTLSGCLRESRAATFIPQ